MKLTDASHAFITGGAGGIGLAIGQALLARGIKVTLADISQDQLASVPDADGKSLRTAVLDVRDRAAWKQAKQAAEAAFGPVDILVNNAGITIQGAQLAEIDPEFFDRIIAINLTGVFNGIHTFAAGMKARSAGQIVNTASMAGISTRNDGTSGSYTASKFGVVGLSEILRRELAPFGVGVTVIIPGMIQSNILDNSLLFGADPALIPKGMKFGAPTEISGPPVLEAIDNDYPHVLLNGDGWWQGVADRHEALRAAFARDGVKTA